MWRLTVLGNSNWPILYHADRTRDGETYTSRSVKATQDGKAIFTMQCSFKTDETHVYHYQMEMPKVKGPEEYLDANEILRMRLKLVNFEILKFYNILTNSAQKDCQTSAKFEAIHSTLCRSYNLWAVQIRQYFHQNKLFTMDK